MGSRPAEETTGAPVPGRGRRLVRWLAGWFPRRGYAWGKTTVVGGPALGLAVYLSWALERYDTLHLTIRDPLAIAGAGDPHLFYSGWLNHAGVIGWISSATVALLAAGLLVQHRYWRAGAFLGIGGILSGILGLDDLLLFHDSFLPHLGLRENLVLLLWAVITCLWALVFAREVIGYRNLPLLVLAGALFLYSILVDVNEPDLWIAEDAAKLGAVLCWTTWFWSIAASYILDPEAAPIDR